MVSINNSHRESDKDKLDSGRGFETIEEIEGWIKFDFDAEPKTLPAADKLASPILIYAVVFSVVLLIIAYWIGG